MELAEAAEAYAVAFDKYRDETHGHGYYAFNKALADFKKTLAEELERKVWGRVELRQVAEELRSE